jgi:hypothetical protein
MKIDVGDLEGRASAAKQSQAQKELKEATQQAQKEKEEAVRQAQREREAAEKRQNTKTAILALSERAKRNEWEIVSLHYLLGNEECGLGAGSNLYWSLLPFTSIGAGINFDYVNGDDYYAYCGNFSPSIGLVFPLISKTKIYANAVLKMGVFGKQQGLLTEWLTPGVDAGLLFAGRLVNLNLKYQHAWLNDFYFDSFGLGFGINF